MSLMKDRAPTVPAPIAIFFYWTAGKMVPSPLHKSVEASVLGLPLTPSLPGETGCFPLAILCIFISHPPGVYMHCPSCPPPMSLY